MDKEDLGEEEEEGDRKRKGKGWKERKWLGDRRGRGTSGEAKRGKGWVKGRRKSLEKEKGGWGDGEEYGQNHRKSWFNLVIEVFFSSRDR